MLRERTFRHLVAGEQPAHPLGIHDERAGRIGRRRRPRAWTPEFPKNARKDAQDPKEKDAIDTQPSRRLGHKYEDQIGFIA